MTAAGGPFLGTFNRGGFWSGMPDMPGMPSFFVVEAKRGFFPSVVSTTELFKENARYTKCLSCIVRSWLRRLFVCLLYYQRVLFIAIKKRIVLLAVRDSKFMVFASTCGILQTLHRSMFISSCYFFTKAIVFVHVCSSSTTTFIHTQ